MKTMDNHPLMAYYIGDHKVVDYISGKVLDHCDAHNRGYHLYMSSSECDLVMSRLHSPDCSCNYCMYGREALPASEY